MTIRLFFTNPAPTEGGVTQFKAAVAHLDDDTHLLRVKLRGADLQALLAVHLAREGDEVLELVEMPDRSGAALRHVNAEDTREAWDGVPANVRLAVIAACKDPTDLACLLGATRALTQMTFDAVKAERDDRLSASDADDIP